MNCARTLGRRGEEEISVEVLEKKLEEAYQSGLDAIQSQGKKEKYAYIDKAKQLIAENYYDGGLSLDMLGQMLGVSPQYLSKLFKEYQAPGFLDYLNRYRLKQAKRLLDETTLMVGEIGEKTGFGSSQSFIRVFKKYEKETPGQYRARQRRIHMNKYLNKYLRSSILLLMFCTSLTACASAGEEYLFDAAAKQQAGETPVKETSTQTLILTTSALEGSTAHRTAVKFKSYVEEEFGDRFEVAIYPNDTLGKLDNAVSSLQSGAVDIRVGVPNTKVGGAVL